MVRRIDSLGRIVIPRELRRTLEIEQDTPIEIYMNKNEIILKKLEISCIFCGATDRLITVMGRKLCEQCKSKIQALGN
jgi:transcriptional pleiotropic regulator of transition state genes